MHPFIGLITITILILQLLIIQNPILIFSALIFICASLLIFRQSQVIFGVFKYSKWLILMILIINPLVSGLGSYILLSLKILQFKVILSLENVSYSIVMAIKMFLTVLSMNFIALINDKEDIYTFFHKHFRQLTLTLSMSSNAVDSLKSEYDRVKMVMFTRGMSIEDGNFFQRIKRSGYLVKVVFTGILEGTFDRSEALYARNFTKNPSSEFKPLMWTKKDTTFLIMESILVTGIFVALILRMYDFVYYPTFSGKFRIVPFIFLLVTVFFAVYGMREKRADDEL